MTEIEQPFSSIGAEGCLIVSGRSHRPIVLLFLEDKVSENMLSTLNEKPYRWYPPQQLTNLSLL